jgi:ATP-binding cassette, subfamily B, multidrug efflux pump
MKILLRLKPYILKYKNKILLGLLCTILANVSGVLAPLIIKDAINGLGKGMDTFALFKAAGLVLLVAAVSGFFLFVTRQTIIVASREIEYDLRNDFLNHLLKLPLRFYQNTPTGDLMAHATNDINAVRNFLGPAIMYSSDTITAFILIMGIMVSISPTLTLYSFIPLPLISLFVYLIAQKIHTRFEDVQSQFSVLTARAQESLSGIRIIKSYVREDFEIESFKKISLNYLRKNMRLVIIQSAMFPLMVLIMGVSLLIVVWIGGKMVIDDKLNLGEITAFILYLGWLIWPMIAFGWVTNLIQQSSASMKRLAKIMDIESEIKDSEITDHSIKAIDGSISFRNVSFRYKEDLKDILENINLEIPKGSSLAIVGYTGSGKTTLIDLILRLFDTTGGEVLIDGKNVKSIPLDVLRTEVSCVAQETFLFSTSLKENIAFGVSSYTEEDILKAAAIAQIDKDVASFNDKYDTIIGERGLTLSGGQKQRVSIARAVMTNPKILILDDSLSAVDTYTEEEILKRLSAFMKERTSIIISHRISTVKNADKIIVIDGGKIVEEGTHDQLLEVHGIYADLFEKQQIEKEIDAIE